MMRFEVTHISGSKPTDRMIWESVGRLDATQMELRRHRARLARLRHTIREWHNQTGFGYTAPNGDEGIVFIVSEGTP